MSSASCFKPWERCPGQRWRFKRLGPFSKRLALFNLVSENSASLALESSMQFVQPC